MPLSQRQQWFLSTLESGSVLLRHMLHRFDSLPLMRKSAVQYNRPCGSLDLRNVSITVQLAELQAAAVLRKVVSAQRQLMSLEEQAVVVNVDLKHFT